MSYEYFAPLKLDGSLFEDLKKVIVADPRYEVLPPLIQDQVRIRLRSRPLRASWPEDLTLINGERLAIAFDSCNGSERKTFVELVASALRDLGVTASFDEG